jgi:GNAT superfamily N-acetyltransferase
VIVHPRNFRERRASWGLRRALYWQLMQLARKLGFRLYYVRVEANVHRLFGESAPALPPEFDTRIDRPSDLLPWAGRVADLDETFLAAAQARGDLCVTNYHDGELVGFAFITHSRAPVSAQLDVLVPKGFQYVYKGWTHPDYRRTNLGKARMYLRHGLLLADPTLRGISYVETHNYPSLLHGYRPPIERSLHLGFCGSLTLFGRERPFNTRRARWIGFELVRRSDPGKRQYVR